MNFNQKDYELISDYFRGNLSDEEKMVFQRRLKQDVDFKKEVQLFKGISSVFKENGWIEWEHDHNKEEIKKISAIRRSDEIRSLESKIKTTSDKYFKDIGSERKGNFKKYFLGIAAAVVILLVVLNITSANRSTSVLYQNYADWDSSLLSRIEQSNSYEDKSERGEFFFKKGEFEKSKIIFEEIINEQKNPSSFSLMYLGASYLELGEYNKSILAFDKLIRLNSLDSSRGYWFKVLLYLKKGDKDSAILELQKLIKNKDHFNYKKAKDLLEKLI